MENKDIVKEVIKEMQELDEKYQKVQGEEADKINKYYENLPKVLKENKDIVLAAAKSKHIHADDGYKLFSHDKDVAMAALTNDNGGYEYADCFKDIIDRNFILELAKTGAWLGVDYDSYTSLGVFLENCPDAFMDNNYMRELLKYPGTEYAFLHATDEIKNDKDVVMNILKNVDGLLPSRMPVVMGDNLKLDPEVQTAFARYAIEEDATFDFADTQNHDYDKLSDTDKEFTKQVLSNDGYIETYLERFPESKETLQSLVDKLNQDAMNMENTSEGKTR